MIEVSGVFFLLFLRGTQRISGDTLDKLFTCREKIYTLKLSPRISIYEGFYILVILLDKLFLGTDLDLLAMFLCQLFE